jgi:hypothetical protein
VHLVVAGGHDVVKVEVDGDAGRAGFGQGACAPWITGLVMPAAERLCPPER